MVVCHISSLIKASHQLRGLMEFRIPYDNLYRDWSTCKTLEPPNIRTLKMYEVVNFDDALKNEITRCEREAFTWYFDGKLRAMRGHLQQYLLSWLSTTNSDFSELSFELARKTYIHAHRLIKVLQEPLQGWIKSLLVTAFLKHFNLDQIKLIMDDSTDSLQPTLKSNIYLDDLFPDDSVADLEADLIVMDNTWDSCGDGESFWNINESTEPTTNTETVDDSFLNVSSTDPTLNLPPTQDSSNTQNSPPTQITQPTQESSTNVTHVSESQDTPQSPIEPMASISQVEAISDDDDSNISPAPHINSTHYPASPQDSKRIATEKSHSPLVASVAGRTTSPKVAKSPGLETSRKENTPKPPIQSASVSMSSQKLTDQPNCTEPIPSLMSSTVGIVWVKGHKNPLSNMYMEALMHNTRRAASAEHMYQAIKCEFMGHPQLIAYILAAESGYMAKRLADRAFKRTFAQNSWANVQTLGDLTLWHSEQSFTVMRDILRSKFQQSTLFRQALRLTQGHYIAHNVYDTRWGTGPSPNPANWPSGCNMFGQLLMELRKEMFQTPIPEIQHLIPPGPTTHDPIVGATQVLMKYGKSQKEHQKLTISDTNDGSTLSPRKRPASRDSSLPAKIPRISTPSPEPTVGNTGSRNDSSSSSSAKDNEPTVTDNPVMVHTRKDNEPKINWPAPMGCRSILIIGDSNTRLMTVIPSKFVDTEIHCYPGMNTRTLNKILMKADTRQSVKHVILAVGINDRFAQFQNTIRKPASALISTATSKYPNAKIYFPQLAQDLPGSQKETFRAMYEFMQQRSVILLPKLVPTSFSNDGIHYTADSANRTLDLWLHSLQMQQGSNPLPSTST